MKKRQNLISTIMTGAVASLAFAQPSLAMENDLTLYVWGASVSGTATVGSQSTQVVDADFDEIVDKLEMAFMGHYEAKWDDWGFGADYTYIGLGDTNDLGVTGDLDAVIAEGFGIYSPNDVFDILGGIRYTNLDMKIATPGQVTAEGDRSLADFFVGGRVKVPFSDSWAGAIRADIGGGDSDLTWNAIAALDWQTAKHFSLRGGYRWLDYNIDKDDAPVSNELDMTFDGPFLAVSFQW